jgi:hypothetical protein
MAFLILSVIANEIFVEEREEYLIDVKFEC